MMGVFSNKIDREELKPGDHIYSWRKAYIYAHHGIYVGDGKVIHFTRAAGQEIGTGTSLDWILFSSSSRSNTGTICTRCGDQSKLHGVIMSCLDCFLAGGNLYRFDYAVSPAFFFAKARGGTCTLAASDSSDDVLHRAKYLLNNGFGIYCLFKNNCEDFAIYCKTGLLVVTAFSVGRSGQLASLTAAVSAVASSPLRFLTTSASGLAVVASGMYCIGRYVSDIGIRRDVEKIPVESLVAKSSGLQEPEAATETVERSQR
ncbi:protein LEAD-SENSITIVE 1-like [Typha latifolia]|uniref:protein LEAD-SENSITIVE 1-like n=1 Tax=Typha latifolia TaxID=4733 RepID=UPI003C2BBFA6